MPRFLARLSLSRDTFQYFPDEISSALHRWTHPEVVIGPNPITNVICVKHTGKKKEHPHVHFVFDTLYSTKGEFDRVFTQFFDKGKGNKHHSTKPADDNDDAFSYLFHERGGTDCVWYSFGHSDSEIERFIELNEVHQAEWKTPMEMCVLISKRLDKNSSKKQIHFAMYEEFAKKGNYLPDKRQAERYYHKVYLLIHGVKAGFEDWYDKIM